MSNVKDFITIDDAKITIEKAVRPKPSIKELVIVEKPGRPSPANQLESPAKKKTRKRKKATGEAKDTTKKEYTLIITEKPQSASKIAIAIGSPRKVQEGKASYFILEKEKILVASAVGHLFNLDYKPGQKGYPIFKIEWRPSYEKKGGSFTRVYYNLLKKLAKKSKDFVIATDYDIEGEVIGWNILRFICNEKTAKRMKYSTLTKPELLTSYKNLLSEPDWGQAYAGESRHIIDWLYGINLSRALMSAIKTTGSFKILSIGRVQGPALKIIVDREREIDSFKSEPYWNVFALSNNFRFKHPKDIFEKSDLEKFKDIDSATAETKKSEESIRPPVPFDLTTLQREAYRYLKISPSQALKIAQKLYLDGLISYPRTSSQKIPEAIEPKKILKKLAKNYPTFTKLATRKRPVEGKKSDPAHPSIYPTGDSASLSGQDLKLYTLIVKRFISAFSPDAKTANTRVTLKAEKDPKLNFTGSGLKVLEPGWTQIYPAKLEESEIPNLSGKVKVDKVEFEEKETQPPKRYSPTSLVTTLERKNLGTKATRSSIVDTLFDRGYLDGKSIKATPLGLHLIEALEKYSPIIIDEKLTRQIEEEMEKILSSKDNFEEKEKKIVKSTEKIISDISKEFMTKEKEIGSSILKGLKEKRKIDDENNILMPCPDCKSGSLKISYSPKTKRQFVACSNYPNCKTTHSLPPNSYIKNTGKKNEEGLPILIALRKGRKPWNFTFDPNWREKQKTKN